MNKLRTIYSRLTIRFKYWVLAVVASAVLVGFAYMGLQQNYRTNANDPQVQYAEDISAALAQGATPDALGGGSMVDPQKSLGLFLLVTDDNQKVQASTMQANGGDAPLPPKGTFNKAKNKEVRFTWAPEKGVRIAAVMQHYQAGKTSGYVLVGRSLKEVESREMRLGAMALVTFAVMVALSTAAVRIGAAPRKKTVAAKAPQTPLQFDEKTDDTSSKAAVATETAPKNASRKPKKSPRHKKNA